MTDTPGEGFQIASAFVSVDPDAASFQEQLEGQLAEIKYVVTIPVEADTAGLQESVDAAAAESQASVVVPVTADPAGLKESVDAAAADSGAAVTVPLEADSAGFAAQAEAAGAEGGEAAGTSFGEKFSSVASSTALFTPDEAPIAAESATAGESGGSSFGEAYAAAAKPWLTLPVTDGLGNVVTESEAAGAAAGTGFGGKFAGEAEAGAETAGDEAATGFGARFSGALSGLTGMLSGLIPGMSAEGAEAGTATGESFMGTMKTVLTGGLSPMEALLGAGFVAATAVMASKFQSAMEMIHTQAGVGQSAISGLSSQVLDLAGKVGESPSGLATSLYHVESAFQSTGITGANAMKIVQVAAEGARTGGADLVDTTNALTAAMASGVIPGAHTAAQAMGALNSIVGAGDMTMQNLAQAMGTGLMAVAKNYGQSIEQVGAALATLGDNNIRGAKAATDLRMTWQAMLVPIKAGDAALQHIGLTSTSLGQTLTHQGLTAAIGEFIQHLEASKIPMRDWGQYETEIFGKRAGVGLGVLVDQYARLQGKLGDVAKGAHSFAGAWAATQQTAGQALHNLEGAAEALMIKIGSALLPVLTHLMNGIAGALPGIEHFGAGLARMVKPVVTEFFTGLRSVVSSLVSFFTGHEGDIEHFASGLVKLAVPVVHTFFTELTGVIRDLVADLEGWVPKVAMFAGVLAKIAAPVVTVFFTGLGTILKLLLGPLKDVTLALGGLALGIKAAMLASELFEAMTPFGWVMIALTALTLLVGAIVKYHEQIWDVIKATWDKVMDFVKAWWPLLLVVVTGGIGVIVDVIVKYHKQILDAIETAWNAVYDFIKSIIGDITSFFATAWDTIWSAIKDAWNNIHKWFTTWWNDEVTGWKKVITTLETWLKTAWNTIWTAIKTVWNDIHSWLTTWWNNEISGWKTIVTNVEGWLSSAWNKIKSTVTTAFNDIRTTIANIWKGIVSDVKGFISDITGAISGLLSKIPGSGLVKAGLSAIGLAGGGIVPGRGRGDHVPALLEPGETVVSRAHSAVLAPAFRAAGVPGYGGGGIVRRMAAGGIVPASMGYSAHGYGMAVSATGFADGGVVPMSMPMLGGGLGYGARESVAGGGPGINIYFTGTMMPTPEQMQALVMQLTTAVGVAG